MKNFSKMNQKKKKKALFTGIIFFLKIPQEPIYLTIFLSQQNSDVPVYKQMGEYMQSHRELLVKSNDEGIRVSNFWVFSHYL